MTPFWSERKEKKRKEQEKEEKKEENDSGKAGKGWLEKAKERSFCVFTFLLPVVFFCSLCCSFHSFYSTYSSSVVNTYSRYSNSTLLTTPFFVVDAIFLFYYCVWYSRSWALVLLMLYIVILFEHYHLMIYCISKHLYKLFGYVLLYGSCYIH